MIFLFLFRSELPGYPQKLPNFHAAINKWIKAERKEATNYVIYNKYFKNKRNFKRRIKSDYYSLNNNQISKYDDLIKKYAKKINWDWRLLAAQVYQESKFDPGAKSWAGAKGLMQVMPATAESLGIKDISDPGESIRGVRIIWIIYINDLLTFQIL